MDIILPKNIPKNLLKRVQSTIGCKDSETIPKVENAGKVIIENGEEVQIMHNGVKIYKGCYHGDWMSYIIQELRGHHEPQEEKVFHQVLKQISTGSVMLELGCFWAYYSLWFCKEIKDGKVYLIEPNPEKIKIAKRNFELNNYGGSFTNGFVSSKSIQNATFTDWDKKKYKIPSIGIDTYMKEHDLEYIDILHSDIQGAEVDMLKGADNALKENKIGYLFISTHAGCHNKCLNTLKKYNYHIIAEHTIKESVSEDGLIVASYPTLSKFSVDVYKH